MAAQEKPMMPGQGDAFAFPIGDGRFSVCRVLLDATSEQSKQSGIVAVLVVCSQWIGEQVPHANDPALRPILHLNHHTWKNETLLRWITDELPTELIPIGTIEPTTQEQAIPCDSYSGWGSLTMQPLMQWRWDHDRDSVIAEDEIQHKQQQEAYAKSQRDRQHYLKHITLDELLHKQFFPNWEDYTQPAAIKTSRDLMTNTVQELLRLGSTATESERMAVLQQCIESFNELDSEMEFIYTIEREEICEEFEAIVHACGLGHHHDLADNWRDW